MSWFYRPELDGVRCLAVYLVVLYHAGLSWAAGGFIGVDLFFVLSGFLVTSVILHEITTTGSLRLGRFYARRVRRLLPAAVVVIVATSVAYVLVDSVVERVSMVRDAQSALLYVANWRFLDQAQDYFASENGKSPFLHFWSLAIEEQFYIVFPVLLIAIARFGRGRPRAMPVALGVLMLMSFAAQVYWGQANATHAYYGTDARLYQLLAGALLAVALQPRSSHRLTGQASRVAGVGGFAGLVVLGSGLVDVNPSVRGMLATVAAVSLITGVMTLPDGLLGKMLARPNPVYLGKISYGTYLWHWPVILVIDRLLTVDPLILAGLAVALSTGLAAVSYEVFEMPIRRARGLDKFRWRAVAVGAGTSLVVAAILVPPVLQSERKPAIAADESVRGSASAAVSQGGRGAEASAPVPSGIDFKTLAEDFGPPDKTCDADAVEDCVVVDGGGPHVVLVGDSNARMLAPMFEQLAKERGFKLSLNIVSSCPWQAGIKNLNSSKKLRKACTKARSDWYETTLPQMDADIVALATMPRDAEYWTDRLGGKDAKDETAEELTLRTTTKTLSQIEDAGARALIIKSILGTGDVHPLRCLVRAETLGECQVPVPLKPRSSDAIYRTADITSDNVFSLDVNPIMCPDAPLCQPVVDDIVVWRDKHHLTTGITKHLRNKVWDEIDSTGVLAGGR